MNKLNKNERYLSAFSDLSYFEIDYCNDTEQKGIHLIVEDIKKYIYIPNRHSFDTKYCKQIKGCEAYSFVKSAYMWDNRIELWQKSLSKLSFLIYGDNLKLESHLILNILNLIIKNDYSCCCDYLTAEKIYQELLPYQSLAEYDTYTSVFLNALLQVLNTARQKGILVWTDSNLL